MYCLLYSEGLPEYSKTCFMLYLSWMDMFLKFLILFFNCSANIYHTTKNQCYFSLARLSHTTKYFMIARKLEFNLEKSKPKNSPFERQPFRILEFFLKYRSG